MAIKANFTIDQGSTFNSSVTLTDEEDNILDLTGYTGAAQLRKHYTSSNSVSFGVVITANTGEIGLSLSANQTGSITSGRYVYDVEITNSATGNITRVLEGIVTVTPQVTR